MPLNAVARSPPPLLPFYESALDDIVDEPSSLTVFAKGMRVERLIELLLSIKLAASTPATAADSGRNGRSRAPLRRHDCADTAPTILALNFPPAVVKRLAVALAQRHGVPLHLLPRVIAPDVSAAERMQIYQTGGVVSASARTLAVDLLTDAAGVLASCVGGVLVYDAHRVTETHGDAFVVRLFRQRCGRLGSAGPPRFIHAFSEAPEALSRGFHTEERLMRTLGIGRMFVWPRFHVDVRRCLDDLPGLDVVELHQPLGEMMRSIQDDLTTALKSCLSELRRGNPGLDLADVSVENALHRSFDFTVRQQLAPVWHRIGAKSRQLVEDLRTIQQLMSHLLQYDCVSFWQLLGTVRETEGLRCFWMMTDAAQRVFKVAKARVFRLRGEHRPAADGGSGSSGSDAESVVPVLDPNGKWELLRAVLDEIREDVAQTRTRWRLHAGCRVLVIVRDPGAGALLSEAMSGDGTEAVLRRKFRDYLRHASWAKRAMLHEQQEQAAADDDAGGGASAHAVGESAPARKRPRPQAQPARLSRSKRAREFFAHMRREADTLDRVRQREQDDGAAVAEESVQAAENGQGEEERQATTTATTPIVFELVDDLQIIFQSPPASGIADLLSQTRPNYVVLYDAQQRYIREIEVFKAEHPALPVRAYLLLYADSLEHQRFTWSLEQERAAFRTLIDHKQSMVVHLGDDDDDGAHDADDGDISDTRALQSNASSAARARRAKVLVDMREFRSALPSLLHQHGLHIVPLTLQVGDYILSPQVCVERKSISDLLGSISSGRLFAQAEAMCRAYRYPMLLIEFDAERSFGLYTAYDVSDEAFSGACMSSSSSLSLSSGVSTIAKMCVLTLHFPRLRLLWCHGSRATAEAFEAIKAHEDEPDEARALAIAGADVQPRAAQQDAQEEEEQQRGTEASSLASGFGASATAADVPRSATLSARDEFSSGAQDMLRHLPGVTPQNVFALMRKAGSLEQLAGMRADDLADELGATGARQLVDFLRHEATHSPA